MSNLINFTFEQSPIRIIDQQGDFWFIANDVCAILEHSNTSEALKSLDDDEKAKLEVSPKLNLALDNRVKEINIINESGLYALILRSRKAMQKGTIQHKFRKWVTSEVLPSIRKTGGYSQKTTAQDRTPLIQACTRLSAGHMSISDVYKMVGNHFGYDDVQSIPPQQLAEATAFVYEMIIRLQPQQNPQDIDNQTETNEMWRIIGQLRHRAIQKEICKLKIECGELYQKLHSLQSLTGMMSDVFAYIDLKPSQEQKQNAYQKAIGGHQRNLIMHGFQ